MQHRPRRSWRLAGYDYTCAGTYFITVCLQRRAPIFGRISDGELQHTPAGQMVAHWWREVACAFPSVALGTYVVMPDHLHAIITLGAGVPADNANPPSLSKIMQWFKTMTTNMYIRGVRQEGWPTFERRLWERSYYDHIIRNDAAHRRIRRYIKHNPAQWWQRYGDY